jgi:hypothetical protein
MADLKYCPASAWKDWKTTICPSEVADNPAHSWTKCLPSTEAVTLTCWVYACPFMYYCHNISDSVTLA